MTEEKVTTEEVAVEEVSAEAKAEAVVDAKKKIKKAKRQILKGRATVKCTYNNTIVSIADINGAILAWASSGMMGFKGAKKATPYAATQVVASVSEKVKKYGLQELEVFVKGVGSGREASIRALSNNGFDLLMIKDITPIPHNGCRSKKPRRV
ncbi:MAG: 30S ribosomal protein S11 [Candidatus Moranbacteria bacterium]|nr:30S ribosomal protein S11 [Candidatus Moranbacteria bacterium]